MSTARDRIFAAVTAARARRPQTEHPGPFGAWRPEAAPDPCDGFEAMFSAAGADSVRVPSLDAFGEWLVAYSSSYPRTAFGVGVPERLRTCVPAVVELGAEHEALLGVCMARAAVAETGSLVMDARDGRRAQLLPPVLVVLVRRSTVYGTLSEALNEIRDDRPAAVGLHSGPSKSADIGQVMVEGVHGPGRVVAVLWEDAPRV